MILRFTFNCIMIHEICMLTALKILLFTAGPQSVAWGSIDSIAYIACIRSRRCVWGNGSLTRLEAAGWISYQELYFSSIAPITSSCSTNAKTGDATCINRLTNGYKKHSWYSDWSYIRIIYDGHMGRFASTFVSNARLQNARTASIGGRCFAGTYTYLSIMYSLNDMCIHLSITWLNHIKLSCLGSVDSHSLTDLPNINKNIRLHTSLIHSCLFSFSIPFSGCAAYVWRFCGETEHGRREEAVRRADTKTHRSIQLSWWNGKLKLKLK